VKIRFHKLTDARHDLEVLRPGNASERVACETRSYLAHDFLHYAAETEARLAGGFYGRLAAGCTLAELNHRTRPAMDSPDMALIEQIVGMLSGSVKGLTPDQMMTVFERFTTASEHELPPWLTADFVERVQQRMRQLQGHFRALAFGSYMELDWPASGPPSSS
jgi:hypothetical protein